MDCCEERGVARHKGLSQVGTPGCPRWSQAVSCRCSAYREAAVTAVQMPLTPGYGETPLPHDELAALLPEVVEVLDKPITRADVYDLEQGLQDQVFDLLMPTAVEGSLSLDELLSDHFVRDLHARMFCLVRYRTGPGGGDDVNSTSVLHRSRSPSRYATRSTPSRTAGCTPMIGPVGNWVLLFMQTLCESIRSPMEMGAPQGFSLIWCTRRFRIPPSCSMTGSSINCAYVELLRGYDRDRDIAALAAFIGVRPIET